MKLTIGMIVKNEEKWLERCLTAIKPILDNVDSELIITDTGSTDRTVDIAKKFTDKVLYFEWIKDFAAARNFGLEKAQGEWFMMLDADDIFCSCDNIIGFFNSGEYKKYNAASYCSRNLYKTENGVSHGDLWVPRMVKIRPETRYVGAVHEYITTYAPPFKNINDIAEHYGYFYETEDERINKFNRNIELLLKRYETENGEELMLFVQLYEAYAAIDDFKTAMRYLEEGIELSEKRGSIVLVPLLFHKMSRLYTDKDFVGAIAVSDDYFSMSRKIRHNALNTDAEIYGMKAVSLLNLRRYDEAVNNFKKYFDTYRDIKSGKIATYDAYLVTNFLCTDINWLPIFNDFSNACIKAGKINTIKSYLTTYPLSDYSYETNAVLELVINEITVLDRTEYKDVKKYHEKLDNFGKTLLEKLLLMRYYIIKGSSDVKKAINELCGEEKVNLISGFFDGNYSAAAAELIVECVSQSLEIPDTAECDLLHADIERAVYELSEIGRNCTEESDVIRAAAAVSEAYDNRKKGFYKECIECIKKAVSIYKPLAPILSAYGSIVINERSKAADGMSEMELLAAQIKRNIRSFIAAGQIENAEKMLGQYRQINPTDSDTEALAEEINAIKLKN